MATRDMKRAANILSFMSSHAGRIFSADDVTTEMGYPKTQRDLVAQTLSRLGTQGELESPQRGAWVWRGGKATAKVKTLLPKLYEYVGILDNGDIIVKGEDEHIYKLERM